MITYGNLTLQPIVQGLPLPDDRYLFGDVHMLRAPERHPPEQSCDAREKATKAAGRRSPDETIINQIIAFAGDHDRSSR